MKTTILLYLSLLIYSCGRYCTEEYLYGEILEIPVYFNGFQSSEINNILVIRINEYDTSRKDTLTLRSMIFPNKIDNNRVNLTDKYPVQYQDSFGHYSSYFDHCHLVLYWHTSSDTLHQMRVRKSKGQSDECHENDPNIRIDEVSFYHKGIKINKGASITIFK